MKLQLKMILWVFGIIIIVLFLIWENNGVVIANHEYINPKLPKEFDGYKIVHISDLHNKDYHGTLLKKIKRINPDIIVITGDLIDRRNTKIDIAVEFLKEIVRIAPTYYVSGNHEQLSGKYNQLKEELEKLDIRNMDDSYGTLSQGESELALIGIADPAIGQNERTYLRKDSSEYMKNTLGALLENKDTNFTILLSHRPEYFSVYKDMNMDLVFSGHAHGGQIRIPFIGGMIAPNQGFFPKYTSGIYIEGATSMVVSRGLGNSIFPLRIFNRPELVVVTLKE